MALSAGLPDIQKRYGKLSGALLTTFVLFYLVSHALSGERGLYVLLREQSRLEQLHSELDTVIAKRKSLEHKTDLMRSESLDRDLLDEQAHRVLGYAAKDEMVIPLTPLQK